MRPFNRTDCINKNQKQQTGVLWSLIDRILSSLMIYRNLGLMISRRSLKDKKGQTWAFSRLRQWLLLSTPHHYLERMVCLNKKRKLYFTITFLNSNITGISPRLEPSGWHGFPSGSTQSGLLRYKLNIPMRRYPLSGRNGRMLSGWTNY